MSLDKPVPKKPPEAQLEEADEIIRGLSSPARRMWEHIKSYIENFEAKQDEEHEVVVYFLSLSGREKIEVLNVGYWSPDMLIFECLIDGTGETVLLQHYSQVNFYISTRKKVNPKRPARRIGFSTEFREIETNN